PGLYMNWMTAPLNPANMQLMMAPLNPALYTNWANAAVNPQTYGTWGGFLNPNAYTGATQAFNPFAFMAPAMAAPAAVMAPLPAPAPMFGGYGQPSVAPAAAPVAQPAPEARAADSDADRSHPVTFVKDSIITAKIKAKLAADHPGSLAHISVDTDKDGNVRLSGTANTQEEIDEAVNTARNTEGVKSVWPDLTIKNDR
ncbi:MAG TPA: BON domain-containing protein, partial [Thiobacillaceae bacterium]|nr:BON domain-containing protein [Thiobacillaceae bacterium]